jgi:hypothetical protein
MRGHGFVNARVPSFVQPPIGPFWMDGNAGQKMLVQVVSPVRPPYQSTPDVGRRLVRQHIHTPTGQRAEVWLPVHEHHYPMTAHWVDLPDGRLALVHKPDRTLGLNRMLRR